MLSELKINNFAIAEKLDIEFHAGLSTITGETGAGKSIMIDALSLALGARADKSAIGIHGDKAHIIASFDISQNQPAQHWLNTKGLDSESECILRRIITKDGKSRAFINGVPSPLQDVKSLAEQLINIHSQHQHQQLLKKETHRELLDSFCENQTLIQNVQQLFNTWQTSHKALNDLQKQQSHRASRIEFLQFQLTEFNKLSLVNGEYQKLNDDHRRLANADQNIEQARQIIDLLKNNESFNVVDSLNKSQSLLETLAKQHSELQPSLECINQAIIHIEECDADLSHYTDSFDLDPEKLQHLDQRLSSIHSLARKHNINASELFELHQNLQQELETLQNSDQSLTQRTHDCAIQQERFLKSASQLSKQRNKSAKKLDKSINLKLAELGMSNARVETKIKQLDIHQAKPYGLDDIEICVATQPQQNPQSLAKIASGGELSRISLAIQVCFAKKSSIPSLIFDEVDVGIGGGTAEVVGRLLKQLAKHGQVICVTHLAQVAAQGEQHFKVHKDNKAEGGKQSQKISTGVSQLSDKQRIEEISRMLGGLEVTQKTLSHAKEMLSMAKTN